MEPTVRSKVLKVPEVAVTPDAVLMCNGCRTFTPHRHVITRRSGVVAFEQIYGCGSCKTERRFGLLA